MPTQERLREYFEYLDGHLYWKKKKSNILPGSYAGTPLVTGYLTVSLDKKHHLVHRLIWVYFNGPIPDRMQIDHINGDRVDNRIENLRLVSHAENGRNQKMRSTNTSGVVGIWYWPARGKWVARICHDYVNKTLGYFKTKEEAIACRKAAEQSLDFHKNHGRKETPKP